MLMASRASSASRGRRPVAMATALLLLSATLAAGNASTGKEPTTVGHGGAAPTPAGTSAATPSAAPAATAPSSTAPSAAPAAPAATAATASHVHRAGKHCPNRCVCFKTTVRCMFLQLDHVPRVPADTTVLDLRFNKIKDIPLNAFRDLKNLHTLLLNNNHLVRLQNGIFNGLGELRYLFLYKNRIREIDSKVFQGVPKLEQLYLHYNELEKIAPGTFSAMPALQRLYLHYNKIDRIPGMAFLDLRNLERLFLHNNKLRTIPPSAFRNLQSLKRIRLDNNWLECDCNALWLSRLLRGLAGQGSGQQTASVATCASPPELQGRPVADLRDADFHCSKPRIVKEPDDVELDFTGPVYFKCRAEGDPEPRIVWLREGREELSPAEPGYELMHDGTLMVEAPSLDPVGAYACVAKSAMGEAKSRVARLVTNKKRERPDITRPPRDWQVGPGETVTLDCRAVGTPPPLVTWSHNGQPVQHSPRTMIATDGTLVLTGLRETEAGEYRCTASNSVGSVSASARVIVNETITIPRVAPRVSSLADNLTFKAGATVLLRCRVDGSPRPTVTWFKDNRTVTSANPRTTISSTGEELRVEHAKEVDGGLYVCRADNAAGSAERATRVQVSASAQSLAQAGPPRLRLVHRPFNMEAMVGTSVEVPCSAEADGGRAGSQPLLAWRKDGQSVTIGPRFKVGRQGSLRIYNLTLEDAGLYECTATDGVEEVSAKGLLAVKGEAPPRAPGGPGARLARPGDPFVRQAFGEASLAVDRAVNATLRALAEAERQPERSHANLYRALRFPDASTRDLVRAADVFEKTLINIRRHVEAGMKMNVTQDFNYTELLSPSQLQVVANLSGCMAHRPNVDCSDMCFHTKYRTVDGTCNNLQHPMWGASLTGFRRVLRPQYENGLSTPIGWNKNMKYFGFPKPSARLVSTSIIRTEKVTPDPKISHMVMQWGQFLDHDLDHAIPSETSTSWDGIDCKKSCEYAAPCYPMEVPPNDSRVKNRRCIDFIRSSAICGSGQTSVLFDSVQPREQINQLTSFVDASQVYGFTDEQARGLRNLTNDLGRLREGPAYGDHPSKPYLPFPNPGEAMDCRRDPAESDIRCFLAGDIRANEQVGLLAMHTVWFREHNRVAGELRTVNPHWDGDTLYHEARKIVGAQVQHITFKHWLPTVLGEKGMAMMGPYQGYDPTVNPGISNAFATAALRFGHSLINPQLHRLNASFLPIPEGHLPLGKAFFSPWRLVVEGGMDPLLRGLIHTPAKLKTPSENLNAELTEQLFTVAHAVALDLAAMNIQRGRDHGLPEYNAWRERCGLPAAETFDDLRNEISSQDVRDKLRELYGHPGNMDLWVGGILEDQVDGAKVGPTFRCLLVEQFKRLRDGDRFYYENPAVFKPEQLTQIKLSSLARVLCDNGDDIDRVQRDVFYLEGQQQPAGYLSCHTWDIPRLDFRFWAECCQDCRSAGQFSSLGRTFFRGVRRYRREMNEPSPSRTSRPNAAATAAEWQNEEDDALNAALDLGLGLDDDIGEERIEGLETAIESFQKAVRQLRRKLRRLEGRCSRQDRGRGRDRERERERDRDAEDASDSAEDCVEETGGRHRSNGEQWRRDPCTRCTCKDATIKCTTIECPALKCALTDAVKQPGECCPKCQVPVAAPVPVAQ